MYKTQTVEFQVNSKNEEVDVSETTTHGHKKIKGFFIESSEDISGSYFRKFELNKEEVLADKFGANILKENAAKSWKDVMWNCDIEVADSEIRFDYVDSGKASKYPYSCKIHFVNIC